MEPLSGKLDYVSEQGLRLIFFPRGGLGYLLAEELTVQDSFVFQDLPTHIQVHDLD